MVDSIIVPILTSVLGDYFINFNDSNFKSSFFSGEIQLTNLIFNKKILETISVPLRLKFGIIGNITITLPSFLSLTTKGIKVKVSNIFLCLEMLEVTKWSEELVKKKYQASKKATLNTLQQNTDIVYANYQEEEKKLFSIEFLHKMLANLKIEVENVHLLYEDSTFKFSTGILLPKIEVYSLNELWELVEQVDDPTVIYKKLTVSNVSVFVNNKKYQSIEEILSKANIKQSIKDLKNWSKEDLLKISDVAIQYLKLTFEDSSKRFDKMSQTQNQYIFQDKEFCIDLVAQVTLNKLNALYQDSKFCQPDLKLDVMFGGLFAKNKQESRAQVDQNHFLGIVIAEEQIEVLLHFCTFLGAYNNFSYGVIKNDFLSDQSKPLIPTIRDKYMNQFLEFLTNKTEGKLTPVQVDKELEKLWVTEQDYRTDFIVRMRKAVIEKYFSERKIKESYDKKILHIKSHKQSWYSSAILEKQKQDKLDEALKKMQQKLHEVNRAYELHILEIEKAIAKQFEKGQEAINGAEVEIREIVKSNDQTENWVQINFTMPKQTITIFTSRLLQQNLNQLPICFLGLQGVSVEIDLKSLPDRTNIQFSLESFEVLDPRVNSAIRQLNPDISDSRKVSQKVIETYQDSLEILTNLNAGSKSKLIDLVVSIQEEDKTAQKIAKYNLKNDPLETDLESENELFQNQNQSKQMVTTIKLDVIKRVYIYSNFYFIKNLLYLGKRIVQDMNQKRTKLLELVEDKQVKMHIQDGLKVVQKLSRFAADNLSKMKKNRLKQTENSQISFSLKMISPKLIIDEYLLSEKVVNPEKPCYFLFDMGVWEISTSIVKQNVEILPSVSQFTSDNDPQHKTQTSQAMFESLNMVISDLKVLYSSENYQVLLEDTNSSNFVLFDKFSIGFQHQNLVQENENDLKKIPSSQINLMFKELKLNVERSVLRQLLKVKTFLSVGSFNDGIKELVDELEKESPKVDIESISSSTSSISDQEDNMIAQEQSKKINHRRNEQLSDNQMVQLEKLQREEIKSNSQMRVNLLFEGLGITVQKFEKTSYQANDNLHHTPTLKATKSREKPNSYLRNILVIQGQQLKISCHLNSHPKELQVVVLLSKLKIKDLLNDHYHFKNIVKIALKPNNSANQQVKKQDDRNTLELLQGHFRSNLRDTVPSDSLLKHKKTIMQLFNDGSPRGQTQKHFAQNDLLNFNFEFGDEKQQHVLNFEDFKNFHPRQEFIQGIHQVSVHFSSSSQSQLSQLHQMQFEESSTVVKFQPLQLIGHFNLISQVMQSVFDVLHDLADVEKLYKEHVQKGKKDIRFLSQTLKSLKQAKENEIKMQLNNGNASFIGNQANQATKQQQKKSPNDKLTRMLNKQTGEEISQQVEHKIQKQRFVLQTSSLVVHMPKLQLTIPIDLENKESMSLQMQTDFKLEQNSNEQHCIKYNDLKNDQNEIEELIVSDEKLDAQSEITIKLTQLQLYMKTIRDDFVSLQPQTEKEQKLKFLKDQLISPFDFQFYSKTISFANHDYEIHNRHLVTLDYTKFCSLKTSDFKKEKDMREKIRSSIQDTKTEMIILAESRIDIEQHFKIQVRVRQLRNYMRILQLITYQQQEIGNVVATPYLNDFQGEVQNSPTEAKNENYFTESTPVRQGSSQGKQLTKVMHPVQTIELDSQKISFNSFNDPNEKQDSIFQEVKIEKKIVNEKNISLQELIEQNKHKESDIDQAVTNNRNITIQQVESTNFTIKKSTFKLETNGLAISLLDDVSSQYEESLVQINFDNLDLEQQSLDDTDHKLNFLQKERLREIISFILDRSNLYSDQDFRNLLQFKLDVTIQASYFNHKSFGEEDLLEETKFVVEQIQADPTSPLSISITSKQFLNINLSYGCILSIYKVIQAIKEDESNKANIKQPITTLLTDFQVLLDQPSDAQYEPKDIANNLKSVVEEEYNSESESVLSFDQNNFSFPNIQQTKVKVYENQQIPSEVLEDQQYDSQLRDRNMPKFKFVNLTGKPVKFCISNESQSSQNEEQKQENQNFCMDPLNPKQFSQAEISVLVKKLLKSYKTDELKFAQLYLSFKFEGYKEIRDISLNQFGVFGYNLKKVFQERRQKQNYYCVIRTVRNRGETIIYFESNSVFLNTSDKAIVLSGFKHTIDKEVEVHQKITAFQKKVEVLPLEWFEKDLQVQLSLFSTDKQQRFEPNLNNFMFRHGTIKNVLNPKIIDPYHKNACQIKLDDKWFALEFALLSTRTKIPQFLIMLHPLTTFHNLMFYPLKIKPITKLQDTAAISFTQVYDQQLDKFFQQNFYTLQPNQTYPIDEINLQSQNGFDKMFLMQLNISEESSAANFIGSDQVARMGKSSLFQFQKGIVIDLKIENQNQSKIVSNPYNKPKAVCCIMEKVASLDSIVDTDYNNFTLRQRIYHQGASQRYEFYVPLVAVNQTPYDIQILQTNRSMIGIVKKSKNLLVDLQEIKESKLRIKIEDFQTSAKIDMNTAGVHGSVVIKHEILEDQIKKDRGQFVKAKVSQQCKTLEIGTSIRFCDFPFVKTKVIKFTNRFQFVNKLSYPIVVREFDQNQQYCIGIQGVMSLNFEDKNKNKNIQVRMCTDQEVKLLKLSQTDWIELTEDKNSFAQQSQWSLNFSGVDVDDFQLSLPKIIKSDQQQKSSLKTQQSNLNSVPNRQGWDNYQWDRKIVRVTVTIDPDSIEKLYCIISKPLHPDYLFLNYLDCPIQVQHRIVSKKQGEQQLSKIVQIESAPGQDQVDQNSDQQFHGAPSGLPIVLNPYKQHKKKTLDIFLILDAVKQINYTIDTEQQYKIDKGQNIVCRTRVAGNMRIIELYRDKKSKTSQKNAQADIATNNLNQASLLQDKRQNLLNMLREKILSKGISDEIEDYQIDLKSLNIQIAGIGISLIDFMPQELCYISVDGIYLKQETSFLKLGMYEKTLTDQNFVINNFQIDAMQNEIFPVLLGPKAPYRNIERLYQKENKYDEIKENQNPILRFINVSNEVNDGSIKTNTIEDLKFELAEIEFKLHLGFVLEIQALLNSLQTLISDIDTVKKSNFIKKLKETLEVMNGESKHPIWQDQRQFKENGKIDKLEHRFSHLTVHEEPQYTHALTQPNQLILDTLIQPEENSKESQIDSNSEQIRIQPKEKVCPCIKAQLSNSFSDIDLVRVKKIFVESLNIKAIKCFITMRIRGIEKRLNKSGPMGFILNLGSNFADITDAEFNFSELDMIKQQKSEVLLQNSLINHYQSEAIQQFYQILGSQDIIGNPSNFLTNITKGTEDLQNQPLQGLLQYDAKMAATGIGKGIMGLCSNTTFAVSSSYAGIAGSLYLGLKNLSGANLTHAQLDQPLTFFGGIQKGTMGFFKEVAQGVTGVYKIPKSKIQTQGKGVPQFAKGVGQGLFQAILLPVNSTLRFSYNLSTGIKNQVKGIKDHGQRYRYPRYFDQNEKMPPYHHQNSHALHALSCTKNGLYRHEIVSKVYDVSNYTKPKCGGFFKDRVVIITNKSLFFIESNHRLLNYVPLGRIKGMMFYFYAKKYGSIVLEISSKKGGNGIVKIDTQQPEINSIILQDLKQKLEQLEKLQLGDQEKKLPIPIKQSDPPKNDNQSPNLSIVADPGIPAIVSSQSRGSIVSDQSQGDETYLTWETIEVPNE